VDSITLLREQLDVAHWLLDETMNDVTEEQVHWQPAGQANPLGASLAHLVTSEDYFVNGFLRGAAPLATTTWAGKLGIDTLPPLFSAGADPLAWRPWARSVRVDLPALRAYAQAVSAASDSYLASLRPEALDDVVDLAGFGLGQRTLAWFLMEFVLGHVYAHCGEISCLKGLQGAKGYPA
jgi:hypothetical protein